MRKHNRLIGVIVIVGFLIGLGWGLWRGHVRSAHRPHEVPLRVLCAENWLSPDVLEDFSKRHAIHVQLFTYSRPSEFLRQMANSDGKVDVICTSSYLLRSLVRSHWIKAVDYLKLGNVHAVSVDFLHLPFDAQTKYGVPLFWDLYGLWGKPTDLSKGLKATAGERKVAVWGDEMNLLDLLSRWGVQLDERIEQEEVKELQGDVRSFSRAFHKVIPPQVSSEDLKQVFATEDWTQAPLSRVAALLGPNSNFVLPLDGGSMELGLLAIGSQAVQPELAMELINELMSTKHAMEIHQRLGKGVVHKTLDNVETIPAMLRPSGLRLFPLTRLNFPDLSVEYLPLFEKIYNEDFAAKSPAN